jgi:hypothetical protein
MCTCVFVQVHIRVCVRVHVFVHVHMRVCVGIHVRVFVHVHICVCVGIHVGGGVHVHIRVHVMYAIDKRSKDTCEENAQNNNIISLCRQ